MTVKNSTEYITTCYGGTFQNNQCIKVQNFKDFSDDENNILCVKPSETFVGKAEICTRTCKS